MTCTNCGSALIRPSTFCSTCGKRITPPAWSSAPGTAPEPDAGQFPRQSFDYPPNDDDTAEFPAIPADPAYVPAMVAYDYPPPGYDPAPGYSPPPSPPPGYGSPISPAVGYNVPVSPVIGYGPSASPAPVPAYAHQATYGHEQAYVGYAPEQAYVQQVGYANEHAYAQQVGYAPEQAYPSYSTAPMDPYDQTPSEGYGAPGQPYAGAPANYAAPVAYAAPAPTYAAQAVYDPPVEVVAIEAIAESPPHDDHTPQVYGTATQPPDNRLSTIAFVLAGLAVLILPFILGLAAIVVSNNAAKQGERLAPLAFKAALAGTAIGCFLGGVVLWLL